MVTNIIGEGHMADKRCSISLVVNGQRWVEDGEGLVAQGALTRPWSLGGLRDYVGLLVGAKLGFTLENCDLVDLRWCRSKATNSDGEAVTAGFTIITTPQVTSDDSGAGLALEAVESAALSDADMVVMVGAQMQWSPLRLKLESRRKEFFELLLTASGKVIVSTERVIDLRDIVRRQHAEAPVSALLKPIPAAAGSADAPADEAAALDESFAANAVRGVVKSLAKGYGVVTRNDGRGDVQFLATHVQAPGFEFVELGDELRFDVVQVASGKWLAQRVVRI
jgi:cold shock CspA family protein